MLAELRECANCWDDDAHRLERQAFVRVQQLLAANGWEYLSMGRHREGWRRNHYVFKIPINEAGVHSNLQERHRWQRYGTTKGYVPYASCRLVAGVFLVMEYALYPGPNSDDAGYVATAQLPEWAMSVDCYQLGYNRKGVLVAYDYGVD